MNIGIFTDVYTPLIDGVVRSIILYKKEMEKLGHNVYIFAPQEIKTKADINFKADYQDDERTFRFKAVDSVFIPGYPVSIPISFKTSTKIPKLKLDVVHCQTPITMGMLGDIVAMLSNIPKIYTYHTYYPEYVKNYFKFGNLKTDEAVKKYDIFYSNRSDKVIVPSRKLEKIMLEWGVKSPIEVLPTGIDLEEFKSADREKFRNKYNISEDEKILLSVGRLGEEKRVDFLIRVIKELDGKEKLFIVGDGKEMDSLKQLAEELKVSNKIVFTGFLERAETIDAFAGSDLFVFASTTDTQGLVLLEAAYLSKPIVMVRDEGLGDVVVEGENGYMVQDDYKIFAEKVKNLLSDVDTYDRMSSKSREIAASYSIENQAKKLIALYEATISEYRARSWRMKFWAGLQKDVSIPRWLRFDKSKFRKFVEKSKKLFDV